MHLFDPVNGPNSDLGWRKWAPIRQKRSHHACAILSSKVIVAGGYGDGYEILKSTEIMDLSTQTVISGANLEVARVHFGMVTVGDAENQMVLAFGGQTEDGDILTWPPWSAESPPPHCSRCAAHRSSGLPSAPVVRCVLLYVAFSVQRSACSMYSVYGVYSV